MKEIFKEIGRDLFVSGLISSHGGNLSIRQNDRLCITRTGAMLGRIKDSDVVETGLDVNDGDYDIASSELIVHRAIYKQTKAKAILHAHPAYAVVLSFFSDRIIPLDSEGSMLIDNAPVVTARETIGSQEVAEKMPKVLRTCPIAVLKGHGTFAVGESLEQAMQVTTALELAAKIIWLYRHSK